MLKKILKEPLLHFLVIGLSIFIAYNYFSKELTNEKIIIVDRPALLNYIQYQSKAFDQAQAKKILEQMSEDKKALLIQDYIQEEVLHREALALGLDHNDYIIKKRLIQKVEFLAKGFAETELEITEHGLKNYFELNKQNYFINPSITFTHVFFDNDKHGYERSLLLANSELDTLRKQKATFTDAVRFGDRFPFHVNYVERGPDFVASHFNDQFAHAIFNENTQVSNWIGPMESDYGHHLVYISNKKLGRDAKLQEVIERVRVDYEYELLKERSEKTIQKIVDQYEVMVEIK